MQPNKNMPEMGNSKENVLSVADAKIFLAKRIMQSKFVDNGLELDGEILTKSQEYGITGSISHRIDEISDSVIQNLQDVDGHFQGFTVEALERINKEYLMASIDASYSQDTMAPDTMAQGLGASEHKNGDIFTSAELLETAPYIVNDYEGFAHFALNTGYSVDLGDLPVQPIVVEWGEGQDLDKAFAGNIQYGAQAEGRELSDALNDLTPEQLSLDI